LLNLKTLLFTAIGSSNGCASLVETHSSIFSVLFYAAAATAATAVVVVWVDDHQNVDARATNLTDEREAAAASDERPDDHRLTVVLSYTIRASGDPY